MIDNIQPGAMRSGTLAAGVNRRAAKNFNGEYDRTIAALRARSDRGGTTGSRVRWIEREVERLYAGRVISRFSTGGKSSGTKAWLVLHHEPGGAATLDEIELEWSRGSPVELRSRFTGVTVSAHALQRMLQHGASAAVELSSAYFQPTYLDGQGYVVTRTGLSPVVDDDDGLVLVTWLSPDSLYDDKAAIRKAIVDDLVDRGVMKRNPT